MSQPETFFDKDQAANYDEKFKALAPMQAALHLMTRVALIPLPDQAHLLVVGCGTGAELSFLAATFPT